MAFCPKCGKEVVQDATFCPSCGFNIGSQQPPQSSQAPTAPVSKPSTASPPRKSNTGRNVVIAVVVIVVLVIVVLVALNAAGGGGILPQQHTVNVVNGLITVGGNSYEDYQFSVPSGATSVSLQGSFTASGGSGNDIEVLVFDATNFVNWSNGHAASYIYDSGQETTNSFNVALPSGSTYYLVYNNQFSFLSSKNVNTSVNLVYTS